MPGRRAGLWLGTRWEPGLYPDLDPHLPPLCQPQLQPLGPWWGGQRAQSTGLLPMSGADLPPGPQRGFPHHRVGTPVPDPRPSLAGES